MLETITAFLFILAAVLAYVAHKKKWKIADLLWGRIQRNLKLEIHC